MNYVLKKIIISSMFVSSFIYAQTYQACGETRKDALSTLSSTITAEVDNSLRSQTHIEKNGKKEQVQKDITSYFNVTSYVTLHNIHYSKKSNKICALIYTNEQKEYTKKLLTKALLYKKSILPKDIDNKAKKLEQWLNDIKSLQRLIPIFLDENLQTQKDLKELAQKEKIFQDLYDQTVIKASSLIFKSCKKNKKEAVLALSNYIFKSKKEHKSFFSSISSIFSSKQQDKQSRALALFSDKIRFSKEKEKECAIIKKDDISKIAKRVYNDLSMFDPKMLSKDPQKRYKETKKLLKKVEVSQLLMQPFNSIFSKTDFSKLAQIKEVLEKIKLNTKPQYVEFNIINAHNLIIKVDDKIIKNNNKVYLSDSKHTYEIKAKNRCSIKGNFSLEKFNKKTIDIDFDEYHYPSVLFISEKDPAIAVDGIVIHANIKTYIPKCAGEVFYIAKFDGQTKKGSLDLKANKSYQFDLDFLTAQELSIFNNAKTKYFKTKNDEKLSDSLTPKISKQLNFSIDDKPSHGSIILNEKGTFVYTPDKDYIGKDSFTYYIKTSKEKSPVKVANIIIEQSLLKKAKQKLEDINATIEKTKQLAKNKTKEIKKSIKEKAKAISKKFDEEKYQHFKKYILSLDPKTNKEKLKKLAEKYPQYFNKFLEDIN